MNPHSKALWGAPAGGGGGIGGAPYKKKWETNSVQGVGGVPGGGGV